MCGIAGYIGQREIPESRIQACLESLKHRGPNNQAHRHWSTQKGRHVYLLHTRLNIIDLDHRSDQPFGVHGHWLAFNGELYNYKELKASLESEGVSFNTTSDTEVFAQLLAKRGMDALDSCEGMWALAWYDERNEILRLSRDRFGEKPLFVYQCEHGLYFSSEVKGIQNLLGDQKLKVNHDHLFRYMVNGYKAMYKKKHSFFKGIEEVGFAKVLEIDKHGEVREKPYWNFKFQPDHDMTFEEAVQGTKERLIRAVEIRLRSDVPIAFCMSGGIDSSSLISIAKNIFSYDVHGFTIISNDPRYDERDVVFESVEKLKVKHSSLVLSPDHFIDNLKKLILQHDAPVCTITYYTQWLLLGEIARQGYPVSVSGTAADEIFSGYYDHHLFYLQAVQKSDRYDSALKEWRETTQPYVRNPFLQDPEQFIKNPEFRDHIYLGADEFSSFLIKDWKEAFAEEYYTDALLRNRMINELFYESVPPMLREDDHNAMSYSIENRSPFLDRQLYEFSLTIPDTLLVHDGAAKAVLREAVRGIAPDHVLDNKVKTGFNANILELLDIKDKAVEEFLLSESPIYDLVDKEKIQVMFERDHLLNSESKFLFNFLCSKIFLEEFT